jgi:hypothetical protein
MNSVQIGRKSYEMPQRVRGQYDYGDLLERGVAGRELGIFNGNSGLKDLESNSRLDL